MTWPGLTFFFILEMQEHAIPIMAGSSQPPYTQEGQAGPPEYFCSLLIVHHNSYPDQMQTNKALRLSGIY